MHVKIKGIREKSESRKNCTLIFKTLDVDIFNINAHFPVVNSCKEFPVRLADCTYKKRSKLLEIIEFTSHRNFKMF